VNEVNDPMVNRRTWEEFRQAGLMWWVNRMLHLFGWALVVQQDEATAGILEIYPARVAFRGFVDASEERGFRRLSAYLEGCSKELVAEVVSGKLVKEKEAPDPTEVFCGRKKSCDMPLMHEGLSDSVDRMLDRIKELENKAEALMKDAGISRIRLDACRKLVDAAGNHIGAQNYEVGSLSDRLAKLEQRVGKLALRVEEGKK